MRKLFYPSFFRIFLAAITLSVIPAGEMFSQVDIRLFADKTPESAVFTVVSGEFEVKDFSGNIWLIKAGTPVVVSKFRERLAVKVMYDNAIACDSVLFTGITGKDLFYLRIMGQNVPRNIYCGSLKCIPDMTTLVMINTCDIESYVAGVVKAEGGSGKHPEFYRTQSVIARTYMYRYLGKHTADHFNLCDNTHCQVYRGVTTDSAIIRAALDTRGEVIFGPDSLPVIAAFHSNCGGETAASEDVWLTPQPYLRRVTDPHCSSGRNAVWQVTKSLQEWKSYLGKAGFTGDDALLNYSQLKRSEDYAVGDIRIPFRQVRSDFNLRSTFFSVSVKGDSVLLMGRGYGHGVGLCQEGAMVMAAKGFNYRQIIGFYYTGVTVRTIP